MTQRRKKVAPKFEFEPIGYLESCFKEKFGIPRQSGLATQATGIIKIHDDANLTTALKQLEGFSHIWLIFVFHQTGSERWKPSIRPPRLGGARKVGVLASRSPHRPNPIGLSAVELDRVDLDAKGGPEIHVRGVDLLDGTPILDLKPYIAYADSIPHAKAGWADEPIVRTEVSFSPQAELAVETRSCEFKNLKALIVEILEIDPRPASQKKRMPVGAPLSENTRHGFNLLKYDVKWEIRDGKFLVWDVVDL